ncbi:hypothetical protein SeMB42_g00909 [Synchytrium endobioticum]|uniref:ER membrane protein complex subunit 7 beta-sandwich domain-containing protein n=1 Tax=Synchytrium endobioticum TaxID=286115 RepID=A0A507DGH4_9FUNG|nr:hypothetical protein SeLEV6574_g00767 [Synchytrium endobioticum]TPX53239.1 hypothetical protein SeMB42_g00909 [Synchytrium endobioticum]
MWRKILSLLAVVSISLTIVNGHETVQGIISSNPILPNISTLGPATRITLNQAQYSTYLQEDGSFSLENIPPGTYILTIDNLYYTFDRIRLDVAADSIHATLSNLGTSWKQMGPPVPYPLVLQARSRIEYFDKREGFNIWGFFANPMMLMSGATLLMIFVLPKIMGSLDPDMMKEIQGQPQPQMPQLPDISSSLANMITGAGRGGGSSPKKGGTSSSAK